MTAKLETPEGYVGAFEGTTKPQPADKPAAPDNRPDDERALKIEDAIMSALEREPRMTLRTLKRKTHAERFGQAWDDCLKSLSDEGELTIENERGLTNRGRTWVALASVTTDSTNDSSVSPHSLVTAPRLKNKALVHVSPLSPRKMGGVGKRSTKCECTL